MVTKHNRMEKKIMDTMTNHYIISILHKDHSITPLWVGRKYGRVAALLRAEHLQETCEFELKALDGERFIPYSLKQEQ
jgi:hypothetical protein